MEDLTEEAVAQAFAELREEGQPLFIRHPTATAGPVTATCIVNDLGAHKFEVIVSGALAWVDHTRTYVVRARDEDDAAQQGLRAFEREMAPERYAGPLMRLN